ncbi:MAG: PPC domain-containing protein [Myxococcaceae bacterium]
MIRGALVAALVAGLTACGPNDTPDGAMESELLQQTDAASTSIYFVKLGQRTRPFNLSKGAWIYFRLAPTPASQTQVLFGLLGGTGNADLYASQGTLPTLSAHQLSSTRADSGEHLSVSMGPGTAPWYVGVYAQTAVAGISLAAEVDGVIDPIPPVPTIPTVTPVALGTRTAPLSGKAGSWIYFRVTNVPARVRRLLVAFAGGSGEANLYASHRQLPTSSAFEARSSAAGAGDFLSLETDPTQSEWIVGVHGSGNFEGVSLVAEEDAPLSPAGPM